MSKIQVFEVLLKDAIKAVASVTSEVCFAVSSFSFFSFFFFWCALSLQHSV
jgi:hypothetical protein